MLKKQDRVSVHYSRQLPEMYYYKNKYKLKKASSNSNLYANTNISLPIYPKLSMKKVDFISKKIIQFLEHEK